jgi:predicted component of type VI protein secretion system
MENEIFAWLEIIHGEVPDPRFDLGVEDILLGRGRECQIQLQDPRVSRQHALIRFENDRYLILDQGSANGVMVNGERVSQAELEHEDVIVLGDTSLRFLLPSTEVPTFLAEDLDGTAPISEEMDSEIAMEWTGQCHNCGAPMAEDERFCGECGSPRSASVSEVSRSDRVLPDSHDRPVPFQHVPEGIGSQHQVTGSSSLKHPVQSAPRRNIIIRCLTVALVFILATVCFFAVVFVG